MSDLVRTNDPESGVEPEVEEAAPQSSSEPALELVPGGAVGGRRGGRQAAGFPARRHEPAGHPVVGAVVAAGHVHELREARLREQRAGLRPASFLADAATTESAPAA